MFEISIASRHLIYRKRQTFLSIIAIALAVGISIFFTSLANGSQQLLTEIVIEKLPHITVYPKEGDDYIYLYRSLIDKIKNDIEVDTVAYSLASKASFSFKDRTKNVLLKGIVPKDEDEIYQISQSMILGNLSSIMGGKNVVLGRKLANDLKLKMGDNVEASFPNANRAQLTVVGIFDTGTPLDEQAAFVSLKTSQGFVGKGDIVNVIEARLDDIFQSNAVAQKLKSQTNYEAEGWQETYPEIRSSLAASRFWTGITVILVMIVAFLGIANTMTMRVMDKTQEIGMLMSIGARRLNIMKIFLLESCILGILGSILGCVIGFLAVIAVGSFKFGIEAGGEEITSVPLVIIPMDFLTYPLLAIVLCLAAGLYPAIRASRLDPVIAIRD
ncbi:MAG: ABC transporter permease [Methanotrichaceae archaeon]|nr:ABC transporter permease [Methanotrichaceae archaeon]